jgi:predicted nucleic acid-binding protein
MATKPRRYWDSDCFIGYLAEEPDKVESCSRVIEAAERGELMIVTSSLTLAEVVKVRKHPSLDPAIREKVSLFFQNDYIVVRQLDRFLAEQARDLWWDYRIEPKDGVHVATALAAGLTQLDTFDETLIARSGQVGNPPLLISRPHIEIREQLSMDDITFEDVADSVEQLGMEALEAGNPDSPPGERDTAIQGEE